YRVPFHCVRFDTNEYTKTHKVSVQVAARELRYQWFEELMNTKASPVWLLTAHHADDNVETLLMNFFKGTGILGLQGIHPKSGRIIRPLLFATRENILDFIASQGLTFVEDSSNLSGKYTRNYFRHTLIPSVQKVFPDVVHNLTENIKRFNDIEILYRQSVKRSVDKLTESRGNELHIPVLKLQKTPAMRTVLYEIVKGYGFLPSQLDDIIHLLDAETGKYVSSSGYRIIRNRAWIIIAPLSGEESDHLVIDEGATGFRFAQGEFKISKYAWNQDAVIDTDPGVAILDIAEIHFPLILRRWKTGDYFYPLGMRKKKKVSRFLIDEKLSPTEKERVWVVESGRRILWLAGLRIDDRFKITPSTKEVLEIRFNRSETTDRAAYSSPGK
ncbi:MAG TPA: tRNA lysidine(34) synthetase TilS, partial [Ginsengibacter sp.]|nr:tRNA lysidine(34) synthetase TilS [Ginsengibacter sp.]